MKLIIIWFILTNGSGYLPPMELLPTDASCGLPGAVVGVVVDRPVNPSTVTWVRYHNWPQDLGDLVP